MSREMKSTNTEKQIMESTLDRALMAAMECTSYDFMDVILVNFGEIQNDCVIHKVRPAIVVSASEYNERSPVMQVVPMTRKFKNMDANYHVFMDKDDCENLNASGVAMIEQMTTIDRTQVIHYIGSVVDERLIKKLQQGIILQLNLEERNRYDGRI